MILQEEEYTLARDELKEFVSTFEGDRVFSVVQGRDCCIMLG